MQFNVQPYKTKPFRLIIISILIFSNLPIFSSSCFIQSFFCSSSPIQTRACHQDDLSSSDSWSRDSSDASEEESVRTFNEDEYLYSYSSSSSVSSTSSYSSSISSSSDSSSSHLSSSTLSFPMVFYLETNESNLKRYMKTFRNFRDNFKFVVSYKIARDPSKMRVIEELGFDVIMYISKSAARKLNMTLDINFIGSFKKVVFSLEFELNHRLIRFLHRNNIEIINIDSVFETFKFQKWMAGIMNSAFKTSTLFLNCFISNSNLKNMKRVLYETNWDELENKELFLNNEIVEISPSIITSGSRGTIYDKFKCHGYFSLIFSEIKYKNIVQYLFNNKFAFLVNLDELIQLNNLHLILKLEMKENEKLLNSYDIVKDIAEIKSLFYLTTNNRLEYVILPSDGVEVIREAFLTAGVSVIHPQFILEHVNDLNNTGYEGFGIVDLRLFPEKFI